MERKIGDLLLDTSVIVDFLRSKTKQTALLTRLARQQTTLYISIITHTELYAGKSVWEKDEARRELAVIVSGLHIIPLETTLSEKAGMLRARSGIGLADAIIAATALEHELAVATLNVKDFKKIKNVRLLDRKDLL